MSKQEFKYEMEELKHVYGKSKRLPAEKLFVIGVNEMHRNTRIIK